MFKEPRSSVKRDGRGSTDIGLHLMEKVVYPNTLQVTRSGEVFSVSFDFEGTDYSLRVLGIDECLAKVKGILDTGSLISCPESIAGDAAHL